MTALYVLWLVSLLISALALAIMMGLILARWIHGRRARSREAERRRLIPLLLEAAPNQEGLLESEPAHDLLADVSTELIQMVRGTDKENFLVSSSRLGVPALLRRRLQHRSPRTRLAAAEALADYADEETLTRLNLALDDTNADVRLAAAMALASAGHAPPVPILVEKLGIGTRENSLLVVGLFQEVAKSRPVEIKALIEDPHMPPPVKAAAIEALSASGDYSLVPAIVELVMKPDAGAEELLRYLKALGEFGHPASRPAVEFALSSACPEVRAAAAEAAGRIGLLDAGERLASLLDDPVWWVRFRAGEALARLGEQGRLLLVEAAASGPERARITARLTIEERGLAA